MPASPPSSHLVGVVARALLFLVLVGATASRPLRAERTAPASTAAERLAFPDELFSPEQLLRSLADAPAELRSALTLLRETPAARLPFTETRLFAVSKAPILQSGTLRSERGRAISLAYGDPPERMIIFDREGLIERDGRGRERRLSAEKRPEAGAFLRLLLDLLAGEIEPLFDGYQLHAQALPGGTWRLGLTPRREPGKGLPRRLVLEGDARALRRVTAELAGGAFQRFDHGEVTRLDAFSDSERQAFFRRPAPAR